MFQKQRISLLTQKFTSPLTACAIWVLHLVFTTTGGMGREATTFYRRLADGISTKEQKEYSVVMGWI